MSGCPSISDANVDQLVKVVTDCQISLSEKGSTSPLQLSSVGWYVVMVETSYCTTAFHRWFCYWTKLGPLTCHAVKPIYWHRVVVKESPVFTVGHQARRTGSLSSKDLNFLIAFREGFLKTTFRVKVAACGLWLVGGEVTGWCFRNLNHQLSDSNQSEV